MAVGAILGQRGIQSVNGVPGGVTGNVDLSAGNMTSGIDMNSQALTGLTTPINDTDAVTKQYTDTAVQNAAPYNWLDNSDFTNLVAQAGIGGNHGSQAYAADRWILNSGSVSYNAGTGLTLNGTITQKLEFKPTGTTSVFVGMASGSANISYRAGTVTITSSGGVIAWAALYEGTYTQDTMPEYRPKGYGAELAECLRYYQVISQNTAYRAFVVSANTVQTTFPLGVPMRVKPSIGQFNFEIRTLASIVSEGFTFTANVGSENFIRIQAFKTNHGLSDASTVVTSDVILSADL